MKKLMLGILLLMPWLLRGQVDTCPEHYGCIDFTGFKGGYTLKADGKTAKLDLIDAVSTSLTLI